jgi:hypothetical protein
MKERGLVEYQEDRRYGGAYVEREVVEEKTHLGLGISKAVLVFACELKEESLTKGASIFILSFIHPLIILYC